jgi:hypothetical protein
MFVLLSFGIKDLRAQDLNFRVFTVFRVFGVLGLGILGLSIRILWLL